MIEWNRPTCDLADVFDLVSSFHFVCPFSVCVGDMRVAVGRWVAHIQWTLIIIRRMKRSQPCVFSQEWSPLLRLSHSREKRKGRKMHKDDCFCDAAITADDSCDEILALAALEERVMCFGRNMSKDCLHRNPVDPLKKLLGCNGLGALFIIMLLLLKSGDVESNPGPVDKGG